MRSFLLTCFYVLLLQVLFCCSSIPEQNDFDYRIYFKLEEIPKTLDTSRDLKKILESNEIPDSLIENWLVPFRIKGFQANKFISYQYGKGRYHVIIIGVVDDFYIDSATVSNCSMEQFLLTTSSSGKLIDGLQVQQYVSGGELDSLVNEMAILNKDIWSQFRSDTIMVSDKTGYIKETVISEREDYIETPDGKQLGKLEIVLQEEYEGMDETRYVIDENGKIKKVSVKKGELAKLSENTGERIKL